MKICLKCGMDHTMYICDDCKKNCDLEKLCNEIMSYDIKEGNNEIWNSIINNLDSPYDFRKIVFTLSEELMSPRKEYTQICCLAGSSWYVPKANHELLLDLHSKIIDSNGLNQDEKNKIRGLAMSAYIADYRYAEAEQLASELTQYDNLPYQAYYTLGDFYIKTRRYDIAERVLNDGLLLYENIPTAKLKINELLMDSQSRRNSDKNGKKEYMPASKEARVKYVNFLTSINIDVELPVSKPKPIAKDKYPDFVETTNPMFDSFVAFDVETTGLSPARDSIIEIGAIKVINGEVIESKEFIFREFVKPYERKITSKNTEITGITEDDVKDARKMWEVIPDFLDFAGNLPLVGFNSVSFDSKFLMRAGRYSHRVITNQQFDVMRYAKRFNDILGLQNKASLGLLSDKLGIENPQVHRALADAITTAKVFLTLKGIDSRCMQ
ncbi:MAG: hypothetical protein HFE50_02255 [Clostridia bacterium]|nr:hypothetical protein [Clostridia bacterium]